MHSAWLAAGGVAWAAAAIGWPARDAALQALGLGFVFSMVLGHAPMILPAVARITLHYGPWFYLPLALLHGSLLLRLGPGFTHFEWRALGAVLNALPLFLLRPASSARRCSGEGGRARAASRGNSMTMMTTRGDPHPSAAHGGALWQLGFRPFYLLASAYSAVSVLLWSLQFTGYLAGPFALTPLWHAHEMLFGFTLAVVVGFLFTAGRNWSNLATPAGGSLVVMALLWLAARVLVHTPWTWASALVNAAFPLAAAVALAIPFVRSRNRRNYFFVGLLALLGLASLAVHLNQLGRLALPGWAGIQLALDVVLFILVVMGGRVIPMFTNNAIPWARATRHPVLDQAALGSVLALLVADAVRAPASLLAFVAAVAAGTHLARWLLWQPWVTLRTPLVWVLHLAYAWIPLHLGLRALAAVGWIGSSPAVHALTVGAIGGLVIGMMTRTARGHTGRPLRADRRDVACYVLVAAAAFVRVGLPLAAPGLMREAVLWSGLLWSAGFALYAVFYWPVLTRPRVDGKPG